MTLSNPITEMLLQLKLSGMEEAYYEQLQTEGYQELGFEDRLAILLERERQHRMDRSCLSRLRKAQLAQRAEIGEVSCAAGRGLQHTQLMQLASGQWIKKGVNLMITGKTGSGKSFLACALGHQACLQNYYVLYRRVAQLITEMSEARSTHKLQTLTRRLEKVDLLVLDDLGLHPLTSESRRDLLEIIQIREMKKSTIVASQLPVKEWHHAIGEGTIADAILDRLLNYSYKIELSGDSMRRNRKLPALDSNQPIS